MTIRILLADDHGVLRAGLRSLLNSEEGYEVIGEAVDGNQAIQLTQQLNPDVVLMDISMPGMDGLEATRQILVNHPNARVLLLTVHEDRSMLQEAIRIGASGYILKRAAESELIDAIQAVVRGDLYIHPSMTRALLTDKTPNPNAGVAADTLSHREVEVLKMIAQGYTNRQIAERLSLSVRTVESHRANVTAKLGLHSRVEMVRYAARHGLLDSDELKSNQH